MTTLYRQTAIARQLIAALSVALLAFGCASLGEAPPTLAAPGASSAVQPPATPPAPPPCSHTTRQS